MAKKKNGAAKKPASTKVDKDKRFHDQRGDEGEIGDRGRRGCVARPHPDETPEEKARREKHHEEVDNAV